VEFAESNEPSSGPKQRHLLGDPRVDGRSRRHVVSVSVTKRSTRVMSHRRHAAAPKRVDIHPAAGRPCGIENAVGCMADAARDRKRQQGASGVVKPVGSMASIRRRRRHDEPRCARSFNRGEPSSIHLNRGETNRPAGAFPEGHHRKPRWPAEVNGDGHPRAAADGQRRRSPCRRALSTSRNKVLLGNARAFSN
jgi:hypothetical protein